MVHAPHRTTDRFELPLYRRRLLMPTAPRITLLTRVSLPPEAVFALWTDPAHLRHWWSGTHGKVVNVQIDPRPRGLFWIAAVVDGHGGYECYGSFTEVIRDEVLVANWEHGGGAVSKLVVQLLTISAETEVTLTHRDFENERARDFQLERWQDALAQFRAYAATLDSQGTPIEV